MNRVSFCLRLLGGFLVAAGLLVNQFTVAEYLSGDGILESNTKISILAYNLTVTLLGVALLINRRLREHIGAELIIISQICRKNITVVAATIICMLIVFQIATFATAIYQNSDNSTIIFAQSWEPGKHIAIAREAKWGVAHSDNNYGVLYFRLANLLVTKTGILQYFSPEPSGSVEQAVHYSLQFISLLALLGIALILSILSTRSGYIRIWMFFLLLAVLFRSELWVSHVFRAATDLTLAFIVALYLFALLNRSAKDLPISSVYSVGVVAALGLSTKVTFGTYLPAALLCLATRLDRRAALNIIRFGSTVCLVYLFIGFPNTLKIWDMIQSATTAAAKYTEPPTLSSLVFWASYVFREGAAGIGVCFLGGFLDRMTPCENEWLKKNSGLLIGAAVPVVYLIGFNFITINEDNKHQGLPQLVSLYFIAGVLGRYCSIKLRDFIPEETKGKILQGVVILTCSWVMVSGVIPIQFSETFEKSIYGRKELHDTANVIRETISESNGLLIIEWSGIPYGGGSNSYIRRTHLNATLSDLSKTQATVVILNKQHVRYIMEGDAPTKYWLEGRENYSKIREFYALFSKKREVEDPFGSIWRLVYEDLNGVQIWKRGGVE